jgi:hypothetical protein
LSVGAFFPLVLVFAAAFFTIFELHVLRFFVFFNFVFNSAIVQPFPASTPRSIPPAEREHAAIPLQDRAENILQIIA